MVDKKDEGITFTIGLGRPIDQEIIVDTWSVNPHIKKIPNETMAKEISAQLAAVLPGIITAAGGQLTIEQATKTPDDGHNAKLDQPAAEKPAPAPAKNPKRLAKGKRTRSRVSER
jgi:hypothetical protein